MSSSSNEPTDSSGPGSSSDSLDACSDASPTVLIIGGSIVGLCSAIELTKTGLDVHVYEQHENNDHHHVDVGFMITEELQAYLHAITGDVSASNLLGDC